MDAELWCDRLGEHLRVLNYSEATVYSYLLEVRAFCEFLTERGVYEPSGIRREDVTSYQLLLHYARKVDGAPLSASTQRGRVGAVLVFLRYLYEGSFILANPGRHVKRPRVPDALPPEVPDEEQVMKLLETPDTQTPEGVRDRAILEVLYACAIRNAELRALAIADIDLYRLELLVRCGKGRKWRRVPMGEPAAVWLEAYLSKGRPAMLREPSEDRLFLNRWGRPLRGESLSEIVRRHAEAARLPMKVTPHILRHSCATHMLARKAGLRHLQRLLGHASASSTERYTRVEISDLREVFLRCHPRESC